MLESWPKQSAGGTQWSWQHLWRKWRGNVLGRDHSLLLIIAKLITTNYFSGCKYLFILAKVICKQRLISLTLCRWETILVIQTGWNQKSPVNFLLTGRYVLKGDLRRDSIIEPWANKSVEKSYNWRVLFKCFCSVLRILVILVKNLC